MRLDKYNAMSFEHKTYTKKCLPLDYYNSAHDASVFAVNGAVPLFIPVISLFTARKL